jgi:putative ABC transport system substrate-binding protein
MLARNWLGQRMQSDRLKRRTFITLLGGAAVAWPIAARAQQDGRVRRVGVLLPFVAADKDAQARLASFRQGLTDAGWVEGRNVHIDVRLAGPDIARQQDYARELVALAPEVILTFGTTTARALREATPTIPIVFVALSDPVATGLVSNLARPEGNVTGFMLYEHSMADKWLNLLKDMAPRLRRVALFFNSDTAPYAAFYVRAAHDASARMGINITAASVRDTAEIEPAIAAIAVSGDGGLLVLPDVFFRLNAATTIALAAKYRAPTIYNDRSYATAGGLMSYGTDLRLQFRDGATYVDRILRGAKPAQLPVQFATKFELVINMKTAKALGLDVSPQLQVLADELID